MPILLDANGQIDASNPDNISDKVLDERETRKKLLNYARMIGCERELLILFAKIDNKLRNCGNDKERADIAALGCVEMHKLLGGYSGGELYVNGQLVCK